jgi:hypothetical protein
MSHSATLLEDHFLTFCSFPQMKDELRTKKKKKKPTLKFAQPQRMMQLRSTSHTHISHKSKKKAVVGPTFIAHREEEKKKKKKKKAEGLAACSHFYLD